MFRPLRVVPLAALLLSAVGAAPMPAAAAAGDLIMITGTTAVEGQSGHADRVVFTASLLGGQASGTDVTARFQTHVMNIPAQPGDATQGTACTGQVDFIGQDKIVTIPANANPPEVSITVPICGDTQDEQSEVFVGTLSEIVGAACLSWDRCGDFATIVNDDAPVVLPKLSVAYASSPEGDLLSDQRALRFIVSLSAPSSSTVTVQAKSALGSTAIGALAKGGVICSTGVDYVNQDVTVTFPSGQTTKIVTVAICPDTVNESNENMSLVLSAPNNATIAAGQGFGIIVDDD